MPGTCLGVIPIEAGVVAIGVIQVQVGGHHGGLIKGHAHCTLYVQDVTGEFDNFNIIQNKCFCPIENINQSAIFFTDQ